MRILQWIFRNRVQWFWLLFFSLWFILVLYVLRREATNEGDWKLVYRGNESLLDIPRFRYVMNSDACRDNNVYMLILIHSAPAHFYNRETIRKSWGNVSVDGKVVKAVFMLAQIRDSNLQSMLETEGRRYGDLVQGNFLDSYRNLTYKHVMGLKWLSTHCSGARHAMKMDDDIFVDVYRMVKFLDKRYPDGLSSTIGCYLQKGMKVMRDETNKWYLSREEYPREIFEDYCSGWAYMLSPVVADKLWFTSKYVKYLWVDDVHVSGTLANKARIKRDPLNWIFTISTSSLLDWTRTRSNMTWRYLIGPTWGDMILMQDGHKKSSWCWIQKCICCSPRNQVALPPVVSNNVSIKGSAESLN